MQQVAAFVAEYVADAIFRTDLDGRVIYQNPAAERMFGWMLDEYVKSIHDTLHYRHQDGSEYPVSECPLAKATTSGTLLSDHEDVFFHKNGLPVAVRCATSPITVEGILVGAAIIVCDISALKNRLEEKDRRRNEFLALLGHELRNPLSVILNGVQLIGVSESEIEMYRKIIERQTKHLKSIVDDLLNIPRINRGCMGFRRVPMDIRQVVKMSVEASSLLIADKNHHLKLICLEEPIFVKADATRINQVVSNLIENSAKYTTENGLITVSIYKEGDSAVVTVSDNGCGIAREKIGYIFDMFYQCDPSLDRSEGGLGIGLTLARTIAIHHNGELEAESDGLRQGSKFTLKIPLTNERPDTQSPKLAKSATSRRILIVDDMPDAVETMATILKMQGHEVNTATTGRQAIAKTQNQKPEIVLLDLSMPEMDGFEIAKRLLRIDPKVTIIAMTGHGQDEDRMKTAAAGFKHHLVKPIALEDLAEFIT